MNSTKLKATLIGSDTKTARLQQLLFSSDRFVTITNVDPHSENISELVQDSDPDIIIDASSDPLIRQTIKNAKQPHTDIISDASAELLFCTNEKHHEAHNTTNYRSNALRVLEEMQKSLYLAKNKDEILKLILTIALQSLGADTGSIMLKNPQRQTLTIETSLGLEDKIINSTVQKLGKGIAGTVARSGKPLLINGHTATNKNSTPKRIDIISAISTPLLIGDRVVGVLNINSKKTEKIFTEKDLSFTVQLAAFAANVIQISKDYEQSVYTSLSHKISSGTNDILQLDYPLQERLNLLMMMLVNDFEGRLCNLYKFDQETNTFPIQASSSFDMNKSQSIPIRLNNFFTERALQSKSPFTYSVQLKSGMKKWFFAHPLFKGCELSGLLAVHLISDKKNLNNEQKILAKTVSILEQKFARFSDSEKERLNSLRFSALSEFTSDLGGIHSIRFMAKQIVANACLIHEAQNCILSLYNETMDCFEILQSFSFIGTEHLKNIQPLDNLLALHTKKLNQAVLFSNFSTSTFSTHDSSCKSALCMILKQEKKIWGSLSLYDKNHQQLIEQNSFSTHDLEVFKKYCHQITKELGRLLGS
jgi:putative methionine-R-sulfoxide reductase with GAF domain